MVGPRSKRAADALLAFRNARVITCDAAVTYVDVTSAYMSNTLLRFQDDHRECRNRIKFEYSESCYEI